MGKRERKVIVICPYAMQLPQTNMYIFGKKATEHNDSTRDSKCIKLFCYIFKWYFCENWFFGTNKQQKNKKKMKKWGGGENLYHQLVL